MSELPQTDTRNPILNVCDPIVSTIATRASEIDAEVGRLLPACEALEEVGREKRREITELVGEYLRLQHAAHALLPNETVRDWCTVPGGSGEDSKWWREQFAHIANVAKELAS